VRKPVFQANFKISLLVLEILRKEKKHLC
jgi:hypothetical protein